MQEVRCAGCEEGAVTQASLPVRATGILPDALGSRSAGRAARSYGGTLERVGLGGRWGEEEYPSVPMSKWKALTEPHHLMMPFAPCPGTRLRAKVRPRPSIRHMLLKFSDLF